jgi:hypothetical protein
MQNIRWKTSKEDLGVIGKVLKCISEKIGCEVDSAGSGNCSVARFCEYRNELSGFLKAENLFTNCATVNVCSENLYRGVE